MIPLYVLLAFAAIALVALWASLVRVSHASVKIVERFGRYHRTLHPGINFIVPGLDAVKRNINIETLVQNGASRVSLVSADGAISTSEFMLDPKAFETIAIDNAIVHPDVLCYLRIIEPDKAVYNISQFCDAMLQLLETTLRQEVGKLDSDAIVSSRHIIGMNVQREMERATEAWGTKVLRVEIQELRFSNDVQDTLTKARQAELGRRAIVVGAQQERDTVILIAEGKKRAAILIAEGEYESAKLRAEGDYLLASRRLQGEAEGTRALAEALNLQPEALIAVRALDTQKAVAEALGKSSNGLIVPMELAGLVGTVTAVRQALNFFTERGASNGEVEGRPASVEITPSHDVRSTSRPATD